MNTKIPEGYQTVMPYLIVEDAAAFLEFTKKVFNAELLGKHMSETAIMHAEIKIGGSVIMLADSSEQYPPAPAGLFIYVDDADRIYKSALDNGATAVTALADQSYGRSGGVKDSFGNTWWITSMI